MLRVGGKEKASTNPTHDDEAKEEDGIITEGADGEEAEHIRHELHIPDDGAKRMKHFLNKANKEAFVFEAGRRYSCDFFNGYLDFNGKLTFHSTLLMFSTFAIYYLPSVIYLLTYPLSMSSRSYLNTTGKDGTYPKRSMINNS